MLAVVDEKVFYRHFVCWTKEERKEEFTQGKVAIENVDRKTAMKNMNVDNE
jgi:hypothetical protein